MSNYYKPKHFSVKELVPPSVYKARGERALELLDIRALQAMDAIRDVLKRPVTVNNGSYTESGLRTSDCRHYKPYSQHSFGRAFDLKAANFTWEDLESIVSIYAEVYPALKYITFIEADTDGWVHFDCRNSPRLKIWSVKTGEYLN